MRKDLGIVYQLYRKTPLMGEQHQQDQIICQELSVHQLGLQQIWVFRIMTIIKVKVTISRIHAAEGQELRQFLHSNPNNVWTSFCQESVKQKVDCHKTSTYQNAEHPRI